MRRSRRVAITVRKRRTSHSTGLAARTGSSDYCVNRLHPRGNLCRDRFSPANSIRAKGDRSVSPAPPDLGVPSRTCGDTAPHTAPAHRCRCRLPSLLLVQAPPTAPACSSARSCGASALLRDEAAAPPRTPLPHWFCSPGKHRPPARPARRSPLLPVWRAG